MDNITVAVTPAQYAALRALSLKYEDMSVQKYADKLFAQVVRNYFKTSLKAAATKAGEQWDAAKKLGFDTTLSREEYVSRAVTSAKTVWRELKAGASEGID